MGGLGGAGGHTRALAHELDGDITDLEAGLTHAAGGLAQEGGPGGALPLRLGGAEVRAHVAQAGGGEQGVAAGVGDDVAVGVADQAHLPGPFQAGQAHGDGRAVRIGGGEGVDVGADAGAGQVLGDLVQLDRGRAGGMARPGAGGGRRGGGVGGGRVPGDPVRKLFWLVIRHGSVSTRWFPASMPRTTWSRRCVRVGASPRGRPPSR